jgi:hypothetical protein
MTTNGHDPLDDELSAAARTLHREWESPNLWQSIASRIDAAEPVRSDRRLHRAWLPLAAAAIVLLTVSSAIWIAWRTVRQPAPADTAAQDRLLSEDAYAEIERSEAQYTRALDELTRLVSPKLEMPDSPLLISLRERLMTIDDAIAETRMQIDVNPFNAQLRRQLLFIYQEKRRTLEQVQEHDENSL